MQASTYNYRYDRMEINQNNKNSIQYGTFLHQFLNQLANDMSSRDNINRMISDHRLMVYNPTQVNSTLLAVQIPQKIQATILQVFQYSFIVLFL